MVWIKFPNFQVLYYDVDDDKAVAVSNGEEYDNNNNDDDNDILCYRVR